MRSNFEPIRYFDAWNGALSGAGTGATIGSVIPGIGTAIGGLVGGAVGLFTGLSQKHKADQLAKNNQYPNQTVPQAILDNQQIARQMANQGLPSQIYDQAAKGIQRQQTTAMRNAADRRSGVGLIGQIQANSNDAMANLNAANARAQQQNTSQLLGVNNNVGRYQQAAFDWNQKNRYNQNYNYSQQLLGAGNQNVVAGIDKVTGTAMPYLDGLFNKKSNTTWV